MLTFQLSLRIFKEESDITPLEGLTNLTDLWVSDNPLNERSREIIEELRGRGVRVED